MAWKENGWSHGEQKLHKNCCQGKNRFPVVVFVQVCWFVSFFSKRKVLDLLIIPSGGEVLILCGGCCLFVCSHMFLFYVFACLFVVCCCCISVLFIGWLVRWLAINNVHVPYFRFSASTPNTTFCMSLVTARERKAVFYRSAIPTSLTNAPLPSPLIFPIQTTPSLKICSPMTCSSSMRRFTSAKRSRRVSIRFLKMLKRFFVHYS